METSRGIDDLAEYIAARYRNAAEIGIGHFPDLAIALKKRGVCVFVTDVVPFVYQGIRMVIDDITKPHYPCYRHVELLYSLRPPPELVPYMKRLAGKVGADLIVKPLSAEHPEVIPIRYRKTTFFAWNKT